MDQPSDHCTPDGRFRLPKGDGVERLRSGRGLRPKLLIALPLAVTLAACGEEPRIVETEDLTVLVAGDQSGGSDVRLAGVLTEVNGCLGLVLPNSAPENRWVAVFPASSEVADDGTWVNLADGSVLRLGDFIESGSELYGAGIRPGPENTPDVPEQCGEVPRALLTDPQITEPT
jgi:hypothetical protein